MKRLVYTPKINAYIKADTGVYDVSDYIVDFSVDRKVNQVSSARLTLRNPGKKWTNHSYTDNGQKKVGPVFHPMDPITITLTRLKNRPVQVFTGYCDKTPYYQLFPGTVEITASCTLKRLLYTYFDPGLPFMRDFLSKYGWMPSTETGGIVNPQAEAKAAGKGDVRYDDSGIGELLLATLKQIGGWDENTIYIEKIPNSVVNTVANLFDLFKAEGEESQREMTALLHKIIGTATLGSGGPSGSVGNTGGAGPASGTEVSPVDVGRAMLTAKFKADRHLLAEGIATVNAESAFGTAAGWDTEHDGGVLGYWQIQRSSHPQYSQDCCMNLLCSTKGAYEISNQGADWSPWTYSDWGAPTARVPEVHVTPWLKHADTAIQLGPFDS